VLDRFAGARIARLATVSAAGPRLLPVTFAWHDGAAVAALDALAGRYPGYQDNRPPGPVVSVTPRRWAWWSAR
jgi:hypothetical protein